jgi:hypothetical protein
MIPIAHGYRNTGELTVTNGYAGDSAAWASDPSAEKLAGGFNGDGLTDIALTGVPGWTTVPIAFPVGDGTLQVRNHPTPDSAGRVRLACRREPGLRARAGPLAQSAWR